MTFNQLLNAVPNTFKCIGLSDRYEFWCKQCSFKRSKAKSAVRVAEWQTSWQLNLSEELERHMTWHEQNPGKSWEEHQQKQLDEASHAAMNEISRVFNHLMRGKL